MPTAMLEMRGRRLLRCLAGISVFGDGLLERARSTSFALLGGIAATGLAIVAFALQLGWPIGADQPLPIAPPKRQAVGAGVVVSAAPSRPAAARRDRGRATAAQPAATPAVEPTGSDRGATSGPVVSDSAPAPPRHSHPQGDRQAPQGQPAPAPQAPQQPQAPVTAQGGSGGSKPEPPVQPEPVPAPPPEPAPEPEAESSGVPGNGNAYGKGNGNGPPKPPPAVGNPHAPDAGSFPGRSGDRPCDDDD
jgi:hypothetical protein